MVMVGWQRHFQSLLRHSGRRFKCRGIAPSSADHTKASKLFGEIACAKPPSYLLSTCTRPLYQYLQQLGFTSSRTLLAEFSNETPISSQLTPTVASSQLTPTVALGSGKVEQRDKLVLRGLKFHGYHGVMPEEKMLGQKFVIDVDAWMDLKAAGISDNLSDTISYADIYDLVKEVVEGTPQNLLESVAHLIASKILIEYPRVDAVRVHVGKPHVAVHGPVDYLGVEILRYRGTDV